MKVEINLDETRFKDLIDSELEKLEKNIQEVLDKDETISLLAENIFYRVISQRITDMIWNSNTLYELVTAHANNLINNAIGNNR